MTERRQAEHRQAAAYFDRSGELFDSLYSQDKISPWMRFLNDHFRRDIFERYRLTIEHLRGVAAKSVLDVGVGGARYARGYIDVGLQRVVGIDISGTMLGLAREHVKGMPDCGRMFEFVQTDIDTFQTSEKFDVVVAMGFFDYTPHPAGCLKQLHDLCIDSVIASFPSRSWYRTPIRKIRYLLKKCPVYFYNRDRIRELSATAGFASCEVVKIKGSGMDYVAIFRKQ